MAMAMVLGLILLLTAMIALVFVVTLQNGRLVARGSKELQSRLLGKAGLSWAVSHLGKEPMAWGEPLATIWLEPGKAGFQVTIRPRGLYMGVGIKPLGSSCDTALRTWAEVGRGVLDRTGAALLLDRASDYRVLPGGGFFGGFSVPHGLLSLDPSLGRNHRYRVVDSVKLDPVLWAMSSDSMAVLWDSIAQSCLSSGRAVDSAWQQSRADGTVRLSGLQPERLELHVKGRLILEGLVCKECTLLADEVEGNVGGDLGTSVVWSRGVSRWSGTWKGNGQILSGDSLLLSRYESDGRGMVHASLGSMPAQRDSLSRSCVTVNRSRARGWLLAPGLGRGSQDLGTRLVVDSLSRWEGGWFVAGMLENDGALEGILLANGVRRRAPDGVLWGGQTRGSLRAPDTARLAVLPWSVAGTPRSVTLRRWAHARP